MLDSSCRQKGRSTSIQLQNSDSSKNEEWRASSRMLRRVALVITDFSEEFSGSIIRVRRIGALGTLVETSKRGRLRRNTESVKRALFIRSVLRLLDTAKVAGPSPILLILMMVAIFPYETSF
jgi:hypothetical protein